MASSSSKMAPIDRSFIEIRQATSQKTKLTAVQNIFAHLHAQIAQIKSTSHLQEFERNIESLTKEITKIQNQPKDEKEDTSQVLFELALIKAKIRCSYFKEFQVVNQKARLQGAINEAIQEVIQYAKAENIQISLYDRLFLFQIACLCKDVENTTFHGEQMIDELLALPDHEKRADLIDCVANCLYLLLTNIKQGVKAEAQREKKRSVKDREAETMDMLEAVREELPKLKAPAAEEKKEDGIPKPKSSSVLDKTQKMADLLNRCFAKQLTSIECITANMNKAWSLYYLAHTINKEYPGFGTRDNLNKFPDYDRLTSYVMTASRARSQDLFEIEAASNEFTHSAHNNNVLSIWFLFNEKPNLIAAIKGFFNAESSPQMKKKYIERINNANFHFSNRKKSLLSNLQRLVNAKSPLSFPPRLVDAGIVFLIRTAAREKPPTKSFVSSDDMENTYRKLYKNKFNTSLTITKEQTNEIIARYPKPDAYKQLESSSSEEKRKSTTAAVMKVTTPDVLSLAKEHEKEHEEEIIQRLNFDCLRNISDSKPLTPATSPSTSSSSSSSIGSLSLLGSSVPLGPTTSTSMSSSTSSTLKPGASPSSGT